MKQTGKRKPPLFHTITQNARVHYPREFVFVDVETKPEPRGKKIIRHKLILGWACYYQMPDDTRQAKEEWFYFTDIKSFWNWVDTFAKPRRTIYLIAHNVLFDFSVLQGFRHLARRKFRISSLYSKFSTTILHFRRGEAGITVLDTMNWYKSSLRSIGAMIGLPKGDIDFSRCTRAELKSYCYRDVEIIRDTVLLLLKTLQDADLGSFRPTAASLAFSVWRHRFYTHKVKMHHLPSVVGLERSAYVGGFVQPFRLRPPANRTYYKLDVNSMYPFVMRKHLFPAEYLFTLCYPPISDLQSALRKHGVVAEVNLSTDEPIYPYRENGAVFYPTGKFKSYLCTEGLRHALNRGHIQSVEMLAVYTLRPIFRAYVDYIYAWRLQCKERGDAAGTQFTKLLLNSLYGKFGQRSTEETIIGNIDPEIYQTDALLDVETGDIMRVYRIGGSEIVVKTGGETWCSFPAIAAHVTEYARLYLFRLIDQAGRRNVVYSDTDSLITNRDGYERLKGYLHDTQLGALKVEGKSNRVRVFAKKDYRFGDDRKLKGFSDVSCMIDFTEREQTQSVGLSGAARKGMTDSAYWTKVLKHHNPFVTGVAITNGTYIEPLVLPRDTDLLHERQYTKHYFK